MVATSRISAPQAPMNIKPGATVIMEDNALLDLTKTQGDAKALSSQKLSNQYGVPIAVHEIRFYVQTWPVDTILGQNHSAVWWFDFGSIITALIATNNVKLTQNFTHLRAFGSFRQTQLGYAQQVDNIFGALPQSILVYNSTYFAWKLNKPLYIPRNGSFDIIVASDAIANRPLDYSASIPQCRVSIAVVGTLQPQMTSRMLTPYPFIAEYAPSGICSDPTQGKPSFAMGNDPVFRNVFSAPLHVHRFNAALYSSTFNVIENSNLSHTDVVTVYPDTITCRLSDSRGNNIAGYGGYGGSAASGMLFNGMPLGAIVDQQSEDWNIDRVLDAYQWFNCEFYANNNNGFDPQPIWFPRVSYEASHDELFIP